MQVHNRVHLQGFIAVWIMDDVLSTTAEKQVLLFSRVITKANSDEFVEERSTASRW